MRRRGKAPASIHVLPRGNAQAALQEGLREFAQHGASEFAGQEAGPVGMGPAPPLVHQPGNGVISRLLHPAFVIQERVWRSLPEEGWYNASLQPERPIEFQLGSFKVPAGMALWLFDYEFSVARLSGLDPGDFVIAEDGRFANQMGFDLTISGSRKADIVYQLDPSPVSLTREEFNPPPNARPVAAQFDRARAGSFASTASPGTALLPARRQMQGPSNGPFTFIAKEGDEVALNCVIFNTLRSPLAFIEGREAGYLIHDSVSEALLNRVRPR